MEQDFVNGSPLQLALREMQGVFTARLTRFGLIGAIVVLGISGPFGTFEAFQVGQRLVYWAATVGLTYVVGRGSATFCIEILRPHIAQRWPRLIVAALLTSLPVTMIVIAIDSIAYWHLEPRNWLNMWFYVALIVLAVVGAMVGFRQQLRRDVEAAAAAPVPAGPASPDPSPNPMAPILARVPLPQRGRLLALVVEDHYVDIVTDKGKALVLMRLADAMRETGEVAGLQIHRSHWVARDAVVRAQRSEGKLSLELSNGMRLPVSRGFLPAVKQAGLA
jgi:DNA-binding LytR/AlgR family response regulator